MLPKWKFQPIININRRGATRDQSESRPSGCLGRHTTTLLPPFFANLSSLCAIWHALGKPSHDRLRRTPTIFLDFGAAQRATCPW